MKILVTGGAGFIGSALIRYLINDTDHEVLNVDKLTYAGSLSTLTSVSESARYQFVHGDICDAATMAQVIGTFSPTKIIHLAAESHVDRSVDGPGAFIQTNVVGTYTLLEAARQYWQAKSPAEFVFHHVSTDEVYGSLGPEGLFTEQTSYSPSSPYSASKAGSDHLVRAWHATYGLPTLVSNCSNNYGPYQFPEKLIPLMTLNAIEGKPLPVYGKGDQIRDWLFVEDHVKAIYKIATQGKIGETYNIGGNEEKQNIHVVETICEILAEKTNRRTLSELKSLITHVTDRPGHDQRYGIDASKILNELGWLPEESFESGMEKTIDWYLHNLEWCQDIARTNYGRERLGLVKSPKQ